MSSEAPYAHWLLEHEPRTADLERLRRVALVLPAQPRFLIVVDDAKTPADLAVESARNQIYPHVRVVRTSQHGRAAEAAERFNACLPGATEEIVAFCDADEILAPDALFEVALMWNEHDDVDVAYGDRDRLQPDGTRSDPLFVPDWSPDAFLSQMYTGRLVFYRLEHVLASGGFRTGYGSALHYDLALRVTEHVSRIAHCARILYHELQGRGPALSDSGAEKARASALERHGEGGHAQPVAAVPGAAIVRYELRRPGRVEIIIPTRDLADYLGRCLESIFAKSTYQDFHLTVVDNGSTQPETARLLETWSAREPGRFSVARVNEPFNFSRLVNAGVRATTGPYIVLLNNDTEVISGDWLAAMLEQAQREAIGAVGARLLYPDGSVQHAGVIVGLEKLAGHIYRFAPGDDPGPGGALVTIRNYSALTAACMMVRRDAFDSVNGFDEALAVEFNDVDFCLRLVAKGYRNVYLPHVVLRHHESESRSGDARARKHSPRDSALLQSRWRTDRYADPYYNSNLTLAHENGAGLRALVIS